MTFFIMYVFCVLLVRFMFYNIVFVCYQNTIQIHTNLFVSSSVIMSLFIIVSRLILLSMPHLVENVKDINDFKYLRKLFVRIRYLWCVTSIFNKDHLKMVLMDAKVTYFWLSGITILFCFKHK